jgi:hypothetical protein
MRIKKEDDNLLMPTGSQEEISKEKSSEAALQAVQKALGGE